MPAPDRHKNPPKAVRMPEGLLAWYGEHAQATGRRVNTVLVAALEEYRAAHDGATTVAAPAKVVAPRKARARSAGPAPAARFDSGQPDEPAPKPGNCKHPRVHGKGVCPDCYTYVASK